MTSPSEEHTSEVPDDPDYEDLIEQLEELEDTVDSPEERQRVRKAMKVARRASTPRVFGRVVGGFDRKDAAEALVGSVIFGIPMLVEGGTTEVGEFLSKNPIYYIGTLLFGVALVIGIVYVADFQRVEVVNPIFGVIPRRLVGILVISFLTALVMMTAWGRVDWSNEWESLGSVTVTFVVMAIGASLSDILPGT